MAHRGSLLFGFVLVLGACSSAPPPPALAADCPPPPASSAPPAPPAPAPAPSPSTQLERLPLLQVAPDPEPPKWGKLGDLPLASGETIKDCQVEYRTLGALNADKSNVVVWATWFSGTTRDLLGLVGPGKLLDSSRYHVVLVGALGNGVSSSPSNSPAQPRMTFPKLAIGDMVESQHRLLTRVLGLTHVRAVMGISMGGMQTFQWGLSYPGFMDRLVPIVGSPRLAPYDLLLWQANLDAIEQNPGFEGGNYRVQPALQAVQELAELMLTTPQRYNQSVTREQVVAERAKMGAPRFDANDRVRQLRAMMAHDVSAPFGGSMDAAAKALKAKLLVIVNSHDHMVTPEPALAFARLAKAPTLVLNGDCGHKAPGCEEAAIGARIAEFLK